MIISAPVYWSRRKKAELSNEVKDESGFCKDGEEIFKDLDILSLGLWLTLSDDTYPFAVASWD